MAAAVSGDAAATAATGATGAAVVTDRMAAAETARRPAMAPTAVPPAQAARAAGAVRAVPLAAARFTILARLSCRRTPSEATWPRAALAARAGEAASAARAEAAGPPAVAVTGAGAASTTWVDQAVQVVPAARPGSSAHARCRPARAGALDSRGRSVAAALWGVPGAKGAVAPSTTPEASRSQPPSWIRTALGAAQRARAGTAASASRAAAAARKGPAGAAGAAATRRG